MAFFRESNGSWRGRVRVAGQSHTHEFSSRSDAEAWEQEARVAIRLNKPVPLPPHLSSDGNNHTVEGYFLNAAERLYSQSKSFSARVGCTKTLIALLGPHKPVKSLSKSDAQELERKLLGRGIKRSSLRNYTSILNAVLDLAVEDNIRRDNIRHIRPKENADISTRTLSLQEEKRIVKAFRKKGRDDDADLVLFLVWSGMRWSESQKVRVRDVDLEQGLISLFDTKNSEDRLVPLNDVLCDVIARRIEEGRLNEDSPIFSHHYAGFRRRLLVVCKQLGIEGMHIHAFRHTSASRLAAGDVSLAKIGSLLGHKRLENTARYVHLKAKDLVNVSHVFNKQAQEVGLWSHPPQPA